MPRGKYSISSGNETVRSHISSSSTIISDYSIDLRYPSETGIMTQNNLPADAPPPRLCVVEKLPGESEYGYNLHAERNKAQFVGVVDAGSPAERGGLCQGDRIFAVNGHSIIGENHKKVVDRIKQNSNRCEMLVIDEEGAKWYADHNIEITLELPNIHRVNEKSARPSNGSPPPNGSWYAPSYVQSASKSTSETPVFVPPPPPAVTEVTMAPHVVPRLSVLQKNSPLDEFGFNLHAERNRGHFIGTVDAGGIGEQAGLRMGQRIVGVNGLLIYPNTAHKEVVALIKKSPLSTTLLVASEDVDKYYRDNGIEYSFDNAEKFNDHQINHNHHQEEHSKSNVYEVAYEKPLNPHSIQVNEERETTRTTTVTKSEVIAESNSYQYKNVPAPIYNSYDVPPVDNGDDLLSQVFSAVPLATTRAEEFTVLSHTKELSDDVSTISSLSSHRESAVDVPVDHKYVPSYVSQSHNHHHDHNEHHDDHHHQHIGNGTHQQPSPLSNGSSHGYAGSSGYDDDDIYHLSAKEARERLRMKNRKHHLHEMSLNEKYQVVSNM